MSPVPCFDEHAWFVAPATWKDVLVPKDKVVKAAVLLGVGLGFWQQASGSEVRVLFVSWLIDWLIVMMLVGWLDEVVDRLVGWLMFEHSVLLVQ